MKQIVRYRYLGTNGNIIETSTYLEGAHSVKLYTLVADASKVLTNGIKQVSAITIPANELEQWTEIDA